MPGAREPKHQGLLIVVPGGNTSQDLLVCEYAKVMPQFIHKVVQVKHTVCVVDHAMSATLNVYWDTLRTIPKPYVPIHPSRQQHIDKEQRQPQG